MCELDFTTERCRRLFVYRCLPPFFRALDVTPDFRQEKDLIKVFLPQHLSQQIGALLETHPAIENYQSLFSKNALPAMEVSLLDAQFVADLANGIREMLNESFGFHAR